MFWVVLQIVGGLFIACHVGWSLLEIVRSLYWAIWETIAVARHHVSELTFRKIVVAVWLRFVAEYVKPFRYNETSCRYYSHGFWPWNDRSWH